MYMVEGRIFRDAALPSLAPKERAACYDAMNAAMARLHRVDVEAVGLADFGRPGNYFERQISRWSRQYREDETAGRNADMDAVIDRSEEHTSELQSLMRISYAVFCLKKTKNVNK